MDQFPGVQPTDELPTLDPALLVTDSFETLLPCFTGRHPSIQSEDEIFSTLLGSKGQELERPKGQEMVVARRRPIPSKGHTKSRRGCYSCKRRKIKCQETYPQCGHCIKAGSVCQYPMAKPSLSMAQPENPPAFRGIDMRFFHHFLTQAYPYIPVRADRIWTHEVPSFAHEVRRNRLRRTHVNRISTTICFIQSWRLERLTLTLALRRRPWSPRRWRTRWTLSVSSIVLCPGLRQMPPRPMRGLRQSWSSPTSRVACEMGWTIS